MPRRRLNRGATLEVYERRIRNLPQECFEQIRDKWITSYDLWGTVRPGDDGSIDPPPNIEDTTLFVIARVALERGVRIRGCTSERTSRGSFLCPIREAERDHVVYCGQPNHFTNRRERSVWRLLPSDMVYHHPAAPD